MQRVLETKDGPSSAVATSTVRPARRPVLWYAAAAGAAALLALLAIAVRHSPASGPDRAVLDWISGWHAPGLTRLLRGVSTLTGGSVAPIWGSLGVGTLWLLGFRRQAFAIGVVGLLVGLIGALSQTALGDYVGRPRPFETSGTSFPSGHVVVITAFFGFLTYLAFHYRLKRRLLLPVAGFLIALVLLTGLSRIHLQAHWPSDVAAAYLIGVLSLFVLIPLYFRLQRACPVCADFKEDLAVSSCAECRVAASVASAVLLDPQRGTATKVYHPPPLIRLLYWLSFQAKFPYESNAAALQAAAYRRKIASLLTLHKFGKDLVAHVTAVSCAHGGCSFVTEFVPGEGAKNDAAARRFLTDVSDAFQEAGLSIWQVSPRNPHAHTNLIRTPEGGLKIIDLESAIVTFLPGRGQWLSALRSGAIPVFDDIDFSRLKAYVSASAADLEASIGPRGLAELREAVARAEEATLSWKGMEPRVWGKLVRSLYRLMNWKAHFHHLTQAMKGASVAAETFLDRGLARWEAEGRLAPAEVARLRTELATPEVRAALHHLGAHLVLSVAIPVPIPGVRSAARFLWTLVFWLKAQARRLRHRKEPAGETTSIHTPLVMLLALPPIFGAVAYLAAKPLRRKVLVHLLLDQAAYKMPFRLYHRLHLARWLTSAADRTADEEGLLLEDDFSGSEDLDLVQVDEARPTAARRLVWLFVALAALAGLAIAYEARKHAYFHIDLTITRHVQAWRSGALDRTLAFFNELTNFYPAIAIWLVTLLFFLWRGLRKEAFALLLVGAAFAGEEALGNFVDRPRPSQDLVRVTQVLIGNSFPSGHVFGGVVFYGLLIAIARKHLKPSLPRLLLQTAAPIIVAMAGFARIYRGAHWPSDVFGGLLLGSVALAVILWIYSRLRAGRLVFMGLDFRVRESRAPTGRDAAPTALRAKPASR